MASDYFSEQEWQGKPIVPPTQEQAPVIPQPPTQEQAPQNQTEFKGLPIRGNGDPIFLLKGGKRYWITSAEVYSRLGFKFGDEVQLDQETLDVIPEGEPIK